jgi:16S rRNA (uracil1498-N3)-methyltransferase
MTRIFSKCKISSKQKTMRFEGAELRYLHHVLRLRPGDTVIICDEDGMDHTGVVSEISSAQAILSLVDSKKNEAEPPYHVFLYQGAAKGERMDFVIQKAVELGADRIIPTITMRSIAKFKTNDSSAKTARWQKIAEEAARQSGRANIPEISGPMTFVSAVHEAAEKCDLILIPWEEEKNCTPNQVMDRFVDQVGSLWKGGKKKIAVFIGPEGGFDSSEIDIAIESGASPVSLGKRILRTETAGMAVLAMLLYRLELM